MINKEYKPEDEQIEYWININEKKLARDDELWNQGFYKEKGIAPQDVFDSRALYYASLGRATFLRDRTPESCRDYFKEACRCAIRAFKIAYDPQDELYHLNKQNYSCVCEACFCMDANYALMAGDFNLVQELAKLFRQRPNGKKMDPEVNDYAFGLKYTLLGDDEKALSILKPRLEKYQKKPPKGGYKRNYHTLTTALVGILEKDEALFNEGLAMQLHFYKGLARGEEKNTPKEFICDEAVALANLGLSRGLSVTVENPRMPKELLIEKAQ